MSCNTAFAAEQSFVAAACRLLRLLALVSGGVALGLVAACASSPPTRFYTLSDTSPGGGTAPADVGEIAVGVVNIPSEIDRPELVRRVSANQLSLAAFDRWAAPLDEMIRRVLTEDIAQRTPAPTAGPKRTVSVDIHEFYGDSGCNVTLRAIWTLKQPAEKSAGPARSGNEDIRVPAAGACPAALPVAMSAALAQLSDRIVAGAAR